MKIICTILLGIAACISFAVNSAHADTASERELKAAYIYHIISFVAWPSEAFSHENEKIEVCLAADGNFAQVLKPIEKKPVHGRSIHIQLFDGQSLPSICHLLFIHGDERGNVRNLLAKAISKNVLTLGDAKEFADKGGMIGFVIYDERVRLEINLNIIKQTNLKVSAKLLEIALHVIGTNGDSQ